MATKPVKIEKGESPLKRSGKAITIDGAFSEVYGDHGYTLVLEDQRTILAEPRILNRWRPPCDTGSGHHSENHRAQGVEGAQAGGRQVSAVAELRARIERAAVTSALAYENHEILPPES